MKSQIFWNGENATRWWWVRHAPVTANKGRIYGQNDMQADTDDPETYSGLAHALPSGAVLVTSNLKRTHQTAAAIADAGLDLAAPIIEPDFAEQNFGDWQGQHVHEIRAEVGPRHPFWLTPANQRAPNGESFSDLWTRVTGAIERLTKSHKNRDIIAVAHGGTIRAALGMALGLEPDRALSFSLDNCSITRIDQVPPGPHHPDGSWAVVHANYRAH